jgi:hypothetical protein
MRPTIVRPSIIVGPLPTIGMASGYAWLVGFVAASTLACVERRFAHALAAHELGDRKAFEAGLDRSRPGSPLLSGEISWWVKWMKHAQQPSMDDMTIILSPLAAIARIFS